MHHELYAAGREHPFNLWELWLSGRSLRYHTHVADVRQNLAEHQWGVATMLLRIHPTASARLLAAALTHDVAEVRVGDLPAPVKWQNPALAQMHGELENEELQKHASYSLALAPIDEQWLKAADLLELIYFSHYHIQRGNLLMKDVRQAGLQRLKDLLPTWEEQPRAATIHALRQVNLWINTSLAL